MNVMVQRQIKYIEDNFTDTIMSLPDVGRDVEFVARWRCMDIIPGRYTTKGFYGEDRLWDENLDVARWRYVDDET
jgi:hypothetical protein